MENNEISNNVSEYVDNYRQKERDITEILSSAVEKYSVDIYVARTKLEKAVKEFGGNEVQVSQVYLLTLVDGFDKFQKNSGTIFQTDIDCYIKNAYISTGLTSAKILELCAAILITLGVNILDNNSSSLTDRLDGPSFVIPMSVYEKEISLLEKRYCEGQEENDESSDNDINRLSVLARGGISRAKSLLGYILITRQKYARNRDIGLKNLEEAFSEGDTIAPGLLGDYYYDRAEFTDWSKAYSYYIHNGATALNNDQRKRLINILNYRRFNFFTIIGSFILVLTMLLTIIFAPASTIFGLKPVVGWIFFSLELFIVGYSCHLFRKKPFDSLSWVPCAVFVLWGFYILSRIIF